MYTLFLLQTWLCLLNIEYRFKIQHQWASLTDSWGIYIAPQCLSFHRRFHFPYASRKRVPKLSILICLKRRCELNSRLNNRICWFNDWSSVSGKEEVGLGRRDRGYSSKHHDGRQTTYSDNIVAGGSVCSFLVWKCTWD